MGQGYLDYAVFLPVPFASADEFNLRDDAEQQKSCDKEVHTQHIYIYIYIISKESKG